MAWAAAVGQRIPSSIFGLSDGVAGKKPSDAAGRYVIKQNEHPRGTLWREPDQGCARQIQVPH